MLLSEVAPVIACRFIPEPTLTRSLALWIARTFAQGFSTSQRSHKIREEIAKLQTIELDEDDGEDSDGPMGYRLCVGCKVWHGEDQSFESECDRCEDCCRDAGHAICCARRCGEHTDSPCSDCGRCSGCCECIRCDRCSEVVDRTCEDCYQCDDCCSCSRSDDESIPGGTRMHAATSRKLFDCTRLAGAEVEYNESKSFEYIREWADTWRASVHSDGSCGWECVTAPAAGDALVRQVTGLCKALSEADAETDHRCGVHVHVDARDFRWEDIYRLMRVYAHVEPVMYMLGGQRRLDEHYCTPCGKRFEDALMSSDRKEAVMRLILKPEYVSTTMREYRKKTCRRPHKKASGRYVGLNLAPWLAGRAAHSPARDTTVEFRMHREYTFRPERLIGWVKLCTRIVDWTAKASDRDVRELPKSAMRSLAVMAPDLREWLTQRAQEYRQAVKVGSRRIHYHPEDGYWT